MQSAVTFLAMTWICTVTLCIGCYLGWFGSDGFARPRPIAYVIMLLGAGAGWFLVYAQNKHGFHANAMHIVVLSLFFAAGFVGTRVRRTKGS
jgi:hypothetical protein